MLLEPLLPTDLICHLHVQCAVQLEDSERGVLGDELALLFDEGHLGHQENDGLVPTRLLRGDPLDEQRADERLAAPGAQRCDDVGLLCARKDLLLITAGQQVLDDPSVRDEFLGHDDEHQTGGLE